MTGEELKKKILEYRIKNNLSQLDMCHKLEVAEVTYIKFMNFEKVKEITKMKIEQKLKELEENI